VLYACRGYLVDNDPRPTADLVKKSLKIYPYTPGAWGTSVATALEGTVKLEGSPPVAETKFVEASGKSFNTIPPSDASFFDKINANVQQEPADSYNVELAGQLAAIGIAKGKPFNPDERMRKIFADAAAPPTISADGLFKPLPPTGARSLNSKTAFYYAYTLDSPGMIMRLPKVGSQYLMGFVDANKNYFDGGKTYKVNLPPNIPAAAFWSFTLYDNQTRSMLQTPQRFPRAGSQSYPSSAAEPDADGSTTIYFGPAQPEGVKRGNWIQTMPGKGWFTLLRLYSPLESFLTKEWRPSEIELAK
jgi:hypothetical protein